MTKTKKNKVSLEVWAKISKTYDLIKKGHAKQIAEEKLTMPQFGVMEVLHNMGSMPLKKISQQMFVTGANITCVVDNLEKENLVQRVHSKEDRRIINAELTSKGSQKIEKMFPNYSKKMSDLLSNLSDSEQKELIHLLDKLSL